MDEKTLAQKVNKIHRLTQQIDALKAEQDALKNELKETLGECKKIVKIGQVSLTLTIVRTKTGIAVDTAKVKAISGWEKKFGKPSGGDLRLTIK